MNLSQDDLNLMFEVVGFYAAVTGFMFYMFGWVLFRGIDLVIWCVRMRGARVSFAERARASERRAERWASMHRRIVERNRREAARRALAR